MSDDTLKELPEEKPLGRTNKVVTKKGTYNLPTLSLSPSQVDTYRRCPRLYYYRYVLGQKKPPGIALVTGTSGHEALEENSRHKMKTGKDMKAREVTDLFAESLDKNTADVEDWEGETKDSLLKSVNPSLVDYMDVIAPAVQPKAVEQVFRLSFDGLPVIGYMDLVDSKGVYDYKFCGGRSNYLKPAAAKESLQLSTYAIGSGKKRVGYIAIVKDKGEAVRVPAVKEQYQLDETKEEFHHVARGISAGAFPLCSEGDFLCSAKFCGFWSVCRGRGESAARKGA